ncbi:MAG: T9SS type A sorting domain-containing protein [Bacteroidota bacterium]
MKKNLFVLLCVIVMSSGINAQIFCPADITVSCLSDLTPDECGMATVVSGNYHPSMVKFIDQNETNACNEGQVFRRFYLDIDYSNTYTENEPSCIQTITQVYNNLPLNIQFPQEREYTCLDEIPVESPTWLYHPCDLVGYTYEDEIFEFEQEACLKIVRTYRVINWCIYDNDQNEGIYEGIQIIKIVDDVAPEIENCEDQFFDAGPNCETEVTLTNSASDIGDCPSGMLTWRVSVDLWSDGTRDLFFGPNENPPFRLDPVENGATVEVVIPELLSVSKHKVDWKVTDGCGNVRSCSTQFFVEDNKPPTPYCINFTGATLNAEHDGQLIIPASFFSLDALDNCSAKEDITLSFSENIEDTERIIDCSNAGLRFFRIYYTDEAGNQDFCEVFILIFDNGTCFMKYAPEGIVTKPDGTPIAGASAYLMEGEEVIALKESDEGGYFNFGDQDLMEVYEATVKSDNGENASVDIDDFIVMRSALLGLEQLDFYQSIAADVDHNHRFDLDDLYAFRDILLGKSSIDEEHLWTFIPQMYTPVKNNDLNVSQSIPYISYGEGFNFYGVRTGDLTGSAIHSDNEIIENEEVINLTLELNDSGFVVISNEDITTDAMQFDLIVNSIDTEGDLVQSKIIEKENGVHYLNLQSFNEIAKNETLFRANVSLEKDIHVDELIENAKIYLKGSVNSANVSWNIVDRREEKFETSSAFELQVYPLPVQDQLTIEGRNITQVELFGLTGERIQLNTRVGSEQTVITNLGTLPSGVYLLKVTANGEEQITKVVK